MQLHDVHQILGVLTEPETTRTERRSRLTPYEGDEWRSPNMAVPGMMEGKAAINDLCRVGAEASEKSPYPWNPILLQTLYRE